MTHTWLGTFTLEWCPEVVSCVVRNTETLRLNMLLLLIILKLSQFPSSSPPVHMSWCRSHSL